MRSNEAAQLVKKSVSRPRKAIQALSRTVKISTREDLRSAYLFLDSEYLDGETYRRQIRDLDDPVITTAVGTRLKIRPDDPGISRQLYLGRIHERAATAVFMQELRSLQEASPNPHIFEIGGNIGYYATLELALLDDAELHVVEPSEDNISLLEENLVLNGVRDRATITRGAISDETGEKELSMREESNLHSFETDSTTASQTETVPTWTVGDYLAEQNINPSDISVLRMDVEGHEGSIFKGIDSLLNTEGPLLVFVELHATLLENNELDNILETLQENELQLAYAFNDNFIDGPTNEIDSTDGIRQNLQEYNNVEAFFKRGY